MSAQFNPYAPPTAAVADIVAADSEAEAIRQEHIKHESSIKSVGALYYLGGGLMVLGAVSMLGLGIFGEQMMLPLFVGVLYGLFGVFSIVVGRALRAFQRWARTTALILSGFGLLGFPIGTLINGYILYLLLSRKGKRVFEPDYPEVIAATPHIKYRTSVVVWVVLAILIIAIAAAVLIPLLSR